MKPKTAEEILLSFVADVQTFFANRTTAADEMEAACATYGGIATHALIREHGPDGAQKKIDQVKAQKAAEQWDSKEVEFLIWTLGHTYGETSKHPRSFKAKHVKEYHDRVLPKVQKLYP